MTEQPPSPLRRFMAKAQQPPALPTAQPKRRRQQRVQTRTPAATHNAVPGSIEATTDWLAARIAAKIATIPIDQPSPPEVPAKLGPNSLVALHIITESLVEAGLTKKTERFRRAMWMAFQSHQRIVKTHCRDSVRAIYKALPETLRNAVEGQQ